LAVHRHEEPERPAIAKIILQGKSHPGRGKPKNLKPSKIDGMFFQPLCTRRQKKKKNLTGKLMKSQESAMKPLLPST
jgi:hypothetical protein